MSKRQPHKSAQKPVKLWIFSWGLFFLILLGTHSFRASIRPPRVSQASQARLVKSLTTNTYSSQFSNDAEKIAFLKRYLILHSAIESTEFHIVYHDNSSGIPGPSDWDMRIVLKVAPRNLVLWHKNLALTHKPIDFSWAYIVAQKRGWKLHSQPKIFASAGNEAAIFEKEGIIFKHLTTMSDG